MSDRLDLALRELAEALREELRSESRSAPAPDRLLGVDEAAGLLGIGRSALYDEIRSGRLKTIKVGRRRLVSDTALREFIAGMAR